MKRFCLWNHTIPVKQRGPLVIKEAWIEIASELNGKFEVIKKRWRNLRDSYKKAKNKITAYTLSGSAAPSTSKKKDGFRYYEQMEFLNDTMITRPCHSNISRDTSDSAIGLDETNNVDSEMIDELTNEIVPLTYSLMYLKITILQSIPKSENDSVIVNLKMIF